MAKIPTRRLLLAGGFAVAVAAAPLVSVLAVPAAHPSTPSISACGPGESNDLYTDNCVPDIAPNSPLPEVDNIPCTGSNSGQCIGLSENQVPDVVPHSTVSSSP